MTIFEQLRDIITNKRNIITEDEEVANEFSPFMIQRWLSFYSHQFALIVNHSTNTAWKVIDEKELWYKMFLGVIPRSKFTNIRYIKKNKESKDPRKIDNEIVEHLAERFEISKKEVKQYIEFGGIDIKLLKKQLSSN